jgi:competence protein ComEC
VLLRIRPGVDYKYGDLLEVAGRLETPPSFPDFDYRQYLARRGISSIVTYPRVDFVASGQGNDLMEGVHSLRRGLSLSLQGALPEPEASLAQGILLGTRSALPSDLNDALNATGTSHIIALSGYNVMLLAGGVMALRGRQAELRPVLAASALATACQAFAAASRGRFLVHSAAPRRVSTGGGG